MEQAINKDERMWATLCHASAATGYFSFIGFVLGPLIVWLLKKDQYPAVDDHGKEALNFQISMVIYYLVSGLLALVFVGFVIAAALFVFQLAEIIIASVKASNGEIHRYPLTIKFVQ